MFTCARPLSFNPTGNFGVRIVGPNLRTGTGPDPSGSTHVSVMHSAGLEQTFQATCIVAVTSHLHTLH